MKIGPVLAICAGLCFFPPTARADESAAAPTTGDITLSVPQVRSLAIEAARSNQPRAVLQLGGGLLKADPRDPMAHYLIAGAQGQLGQPGAGRKSARLAYRFADTRMHRFEAAEMAARLAWAEERPTLTQLWLRRAVQNAPSPAIEAQLGKDYARVRAQNPLSFALRAGLRPSSNVNNGADTALQIVEGVPVTGVLSGSAQALSGLIATSDLSLGYRIAGSARSQTMIGARLYLQRVALSDKAKALAPESRNRDFGYTYSEVSLDHATLLGTSGNSARMGAAVGQMWSAGTRSYDFARLTGGHSWRLDAATQVYLSGSLEQRDMARAGASDSTHIGLTGGVSRQLEDGDRLSFSLSLQKVDSDFVNARSVTASLRASYAFAEQVGPAQITAGLVIGHSDFSDYVVFVPVPGGRQDTSIYGDVNLMFPDYDYMGFAPTLRVRTGRKSSNVSRFDTRELSVSLGIESKF